MEIFPLVAALRLYIFCFRKHATSAGSGKRVIKETSTSILFGATFNVSRFSKLETKDGMSRRFLFYVAEKTGREILNPPRPDASQFTDILLRFGELKEMKGEMILASNSIPIWNEY